MTQKMQNVLVLDNVDKICEEILKDAGLQVTSVPKMTQEKLLQELQNYDALVVRSATKVTSDVLGASDRLKLVGRAGTGVDNVDVGAATRRGVLVMNTPGGNTLSAAEHTCAMICALSRSIPQACAALKNGAWERKAFMGSELHGKTLAIVGLGRIGTEVAKRMRSFGMHIVGYDPIVAPEVVKSMDIDPLPLKILWTKADYVTVHVPLLPETRNLINDDVLKIMKPGVKIVNVARGGIVDEAAILRALDSSHCGGAALDVFLEEPPTDLRLCRHPKVICTPHLGANTIEAQKRVAKEIAQQIVEMVQGGSLIGVVNAPALAGGNGMGSKPWITLAEAMGRLGARFCSPKEPTAVSLDIKLFGDKLSKMEGLLKPAVLVGLMSDKTENEINLVNADIIAMEAGVSVVISHSSEKSHAIPGVSVAISVTVQQGAMTRTFLGSSVCGQPTLFALDDSVWQSGLTLDHNMFFFKASTDSNSSIAAIAASLTVLDVALISILTSSKNEKDLWCVAKTLSGVQNMPAIEGVELMAQIPFVAS